MSHDGLSASTLVTPGMWAALSQSFLSAHHFQRAQVRSFSTADFEPILFRQLTVVVLSVMILMCESVT